MKGIICEAFGDATPSVMQLKSDLVIPQPSDSQVRRNEAFALNLMTKIVQDGHSLSLSLLIGFSVHRFWSGFILLESTLSTLTFVVVITLHYRHCHIRRVWKLLRYLDY